MVTVCLRIGGRHRRLPIKPQRNDPILKLLRIRILIVHSPPRVLPSHLEVLLLLNQSVHCLIELEEALGEGVVALPNHTLRLFVERVDIEV